jgi:hypothetical protein
MAETFKRLCRPALGAVPVKFLRPASYRHTMDLPGFQRAQCEIMLSAQ